MTTENVQGQSQSSNLPPLVTHDQLNQQRAPTPSVSPELANVSGTAKKLCADVFAQVLGKPADPTPAQEPVAQKIPELPSLFSDDSKQEPQVTPIQNSDEPSQKPLAQEEEAPLDASDPTTSGDSDTSDEENSAEINFKKLRTSLQETKQTLTQTQTELEQLRAKVAKYENGEEYPDSVRAMAERITELEKYEKVVNLRQSPEYQEKIVEPLQQLDAQLDEYKASYGLSEDFLAKALRTENKAELNKLLSSRLDPTGALEVKAIVTEIQRLASEVKKANDEPETVMSKLVSEANAAKAADLQRKKEALSTTSKNVWVDVCEEVVKAGKFTELIEKPDDPEYNEKWVKPLRSKAAEEYGKVIKTLADHGAVELPEPFLKSLARTIQYAVASSVAVETRNLAVADLNKILNSVEKDADVFRPRVGSPRGNGGTPPAPPQTNSFTEGLRNITKNIIAQK